MRAPDPAQRVGTSIELLLARLGQVVSGLGALGALWAAGTGGGATSVGLFLLSGASVTAYTIVRMMLVAGEPTGSASEWAAPEWVRWVAPTLETLLPTLVLAVLAFTGDAQSALASWLPPALFGAVLSLSIIRADPRVPAVIGAGASACYLTLYVLALAPELDPRAPEAAVTLHLGRAMGLFLCGSAAAWAAWRLQAILSPPGGTPSATTLGPYTLLHEVAAGGMGRVFDALYAPPQPESGARTAPAVEFQRRVALKVMHAHLASRGEYVVRFRNEAALAARLAHPNVVGAFDYGCHAGSWYYAMEFVDGRPLSDLLAEHRRVSRALPPRVVASLVAQVASGLRHAHEVAADEDGQPLRVVHRDLSPSNVLVDRTGRAHIADFGVARALYDADSATTKVLTGKPSYVAPEALRDGVIDPRIDIWSLGVILWEALTNRRLFARDSEAASMVAVVEAEIPRPTTLRPELDLRWDVLVERMLARNPDERHQTATDVLEHLQELATTEGSVTPADLAALLAPEDGFDELPLENTADESGGQRKRGGGAP